MKKLTKKELLEKQLSSITAKQTKKLKPVEPNKQAGIAYNSELQRIVSSVKKDIDRLLVPQIKLLQPDYTADSIRTNDGWFDLISATIAAIRKKYSGDKFNTFANGIANSFVKAADLNNAKKSANNYEGFGVDILNNKSVTEYIKASSGDNARLITSIPEQYLSQIESLVTANMRAGNRASSITDLIHDKYGVTKARAKMIARDQTSKLNSQLSEKRMRSAGVKLFQWIDSKDSKVRTKHLKISDKVTKFGKGVYSWDDLPLSDKGEPISPGFDYLCRCIARPVLQSEVDRNIKAGLTNPKVSR